jgi:hypothetical protein
VPGIFTVLYKPLGSSRSESVGVLLDHTDMISVALERGEMAFCSFVVIINEQ